MSTTTWPWPLTLAARMGHTVCTVESWSRRHPVGTVAAEVIEPPFLNPDGMAPKQSTTR